MNSDETMNMPNIQSKSDRDRGRKRGNNEDFVASYQPTDSKEYAASGCLYIVADGVGSTTGGERASEFAAQKVLYEYYQENDLEPAERLRQVIAHASTELHAHAESKGIRMATTLVAAVVRGNHLIVANVGDSRAYLIRNGQARQLTRDHSLAGEMVRNGEMSEAQAQASKIKNKLTRSLGGEATVLVDVFPPQPLQPGDKILLCTDGLTRYALPEDIARLTAQGSPEQIVPRLIDFANQRGGADNIAVSLIAFEPQPVQESDGALDTLTEGAPPPLAPKKKTEWFKLPLVWAAVGLMAILLVVVGFALRSIFDITPSTSVPSETPFTSTITSQPDLNAHPLATEPVIIDTPVPQPTFTEEPLEDTPLNPTLSFEPEPLIACEYTFKSGDTLSEVARTLGLSNYQDAYCSSKKGNLSCQTSNPGNMMAGYIIIFPNSLSQACKDNLGRVLVQGKVICDNPETCQVDLHEYPSNSSPLLAYLKYNDQLMLEYVCPVTAAGDEGRWFRIYPYYQGSTISKPMWIREGYVRDVNSLVDNTSFYCPPTPTPAPTFTLTPSATP